MTPIKIILIILLIIVLRAFLVQKSLMLVKRMIAISMFLVLILLVILPDISTKIANTIGVGRGADLVFYLSHLLIFLLIVALWRRTEVLMTTITKLTRRNAIDNARKVESDNSTLGS